MRALLQDIGYFGRTAGKSPGFFAVAVLTLALGAGHRELLRLVLGHAAVLVAAGPAVGLGAALWLSRLLKSLLFGLAPDDPITFLAVTGLLVLVALIACVIPARRAMRVDPVVALRCE
jgi:ABC-type antimicrobial peptide transport system permease subunit